MSFARSTLVPLIDRWRRDIFTFSREGLRFFPSEQQSQLFRAIQDAAFRVPGAKNHIACASGQGPGKTFATGVAALWLGMRTRHVKSIVTAPTMRQLRQAWLEGVRRRLEVAHPVLRRYIKATMSNVVYNGNPNWAIHLVTSAKEISLQGQHHPNMFVIMEEAAGIEFSQWEQWEGTTSEAGNILIAIGNPNTRQCPFFECFYKYGHLWKTMKWSAKDSPFVSKQNIEYLAEKYGEHSDVFRVRVLGEFPSEDPRSVIAAEDILECQKLDKIELAAEERIFNVGRARTISIDFARFGSDESVIMQRQGNAIIDIKAYHHQEPSDVAHQAIVLAKTLGWDEQPDFCLVPDANGMGQGVLGLFRGLPVYSFYAQGSSTSSEFANLITEAWFNAASYVKRRKVYIPKDSLLFDQLTDRYYSIDKTSGKLKIESKDDYEKRTGRTSPDRADAFVMAMYDHCVTKGRVAVGSLKPKPLTPIKEFR